MEILGPSNNRPLTISDENLTVGSLFKRSATLVLVPTQSYTSVAYETAASAGTGLFSQAYGMISGAVSAIWNLSNFAPRTEEQPPPSRRGGERVGGGDDARRPGPSGSSQLRTLRDQSVDRDERKYYNGNQVCLPHAVFCGCYADEPNSSASSQSLTETEGVCVFEVVF